MKKFKALVKSGLEIKAMRFENLKLMNFKSILKIMKFDDP